MAETPIADLMKCGCGNDHPHLLTDDDVFERLDQMWSNEEVELFWSFEEILNSDDFLLFHCTPWLWSKYVTSKSNA